MSSVTLSLISQFPGLLSYCMTKAAVDQFTQCVALGKNLLPTPICNKCISDFSTEALSSVAMSLTLAERFLVRREKSYFFGKVYHIGINVHGFI